MARHRRVLKTGKDTESSEAHLYDCSVDGDPEDVLDGVEFFED
jgi:hypothetical protein